MASGATCVPAGGKEAMKNTERLREFLLSGLLRVYCWLTVWRADVRKGPVEPSAVRCMRKRERAESVLFGGETNGKHGRANKWTSRGGASHPFG